MNTASRFTVAAAAGFVVGAGLFSPLGRMLFRLARQEASGREIVAFVPHPSGNGGWSLDRQGNIMAFGNAPEFREVPQPVPWRQTSFVSMACTPSGRGLWVLDRRGSIFSFGDAPEFREVPQPEPWREHSFVAIAATPTGRGVWVLDAAGSVLSYGDAAELGPPRLRR
jgi:hypothetical protein